MKATLLTNRYEVNVRDDENGDKKFSIENYKNYFYTGSKEELAYTLWMWTKGKDVFFKIEKPGETSLGTHIIGTANDAYLYCKSANVDCPSTTINSLFNLVKIINQ